MLIETILTRLRQLASIVLLRNRRKNFQKSPQSQQREAFTNEISRSILAQSIISVDKTQHLFVTATNAPSLCALAAIITVLLAGNLSAQVREGFEDDGPRLSLWYSDARAQVTSREMTTTFPFTGQRSESIEVNCAGGSFIYLVYPLRPAALIPELSGSVHMRAASRGLRVGFRVILPRSVHPASGSPIALILFSGTPYEGRGQWSRLDINNIMPTFEDQLRIKNRELGYAIDKADAFVDAMVFDVYNGPGATRIQIDDLAVDGLIDASALAGTDQSSIAPVVNQLPDLPTQLVQFRRTVPRLIQYNGEDLAWLKSIGFTGLHSEQPINRDIVGHAARTSLQLIAPPPNPSEIGTISESSSTITSWHLASAASLGDLENTRNLSLQTNHLIPSLTRPKFVEAMESHALFSRYADIIAYPIPPPTTVNSSGQVDQILSEQMRQAGPRALPIASVVVQPPLSWTAQCQALRLQLQQRGLNNIGNPPEMANSVQMRQGVARAVSLGFRGFLFRSTSQLDSGSERDFARSSSLEAINAELELLRPWLESGQAPQNITQISNALFTGKSINTERSTLMIFTTQGDFDQIAPVSSQGTALEFMIPRRNNGEQAYRITHGALESLASAARPEGWGLRIANSSTVEYVVVTNDLAVLQYLQSALPAYASKVMTSRIQSAGDYLTLAQEVLHQEGVPPNDPWWARVQSAAAALRNANGNQNQNNIVAAIRDSELSMNDSIELIRASWLRAQNNYHDPRCSPFLTNITSLPLAWQLEQVIRNRQWQPHAIPAGEFTSMQQMIDAGWAYDRRITDRVQNELSVVEGAGPNGSPAMILRAASIAGDPIPGGFAGSSMHIRSPDIESYLGRVVRIRGRVRIDQGSAEPLAGLLCYDSLGGSLLGVPVAADASVVGQWQDFEVYRVVNRQEPLQLHIDVRGAIAATIDRWSVDSMTLLPTANYVTVPANP